MAETTIPIPNPPGLPLIGNVGDIDAAYPMGSMINMADKYGLSTHHRFSPQNTLN